MQNQRTPICPENAEVAAFLWDKWQEMAQKPKGISENLNNTMYKAYSGLCSFKTPVKSLKDLAEIKGVGKWTLKLMQGFFNNGSGNSEGEEVTKKGNGEKGARRYLPQKNSVAYALLITLYRGTTNGTEFMRKQELIDAAEGSGLSRVSIAPEKGKGKPGQFGSSPRDWYSGWSCMKTLVAKGLVVKSSCPAKYMLTEEGKKAARDCLSRSGLDSSDNAAIVPAIPGPVPQRTLITESTDDIVATSSAGDSAKGVARSAFTKASRSKSIDVPPESLDKFLAMGYSKEQIMRAFREASGASGKKDATSLWPAVLCCLKEYQLYDLHNESGSTQMHNDCREPTGSARKGGSCGSQLDDDRSINKARSSAVESVKPSGHPHFSPSFRALKSCSSSDMGEATVSKSNTVAKPPLNFGERFEDVYEVVLVLDDREHFASKGSRSKKIIENVCIQFKVQIEVRRLPVGDAIWLARHKSIGTEYVLDFIVERKRIHDLQSSIRDNRYKDQKLRLLRLGLKKMIYLVEGDPNSSEAAEAIKTACFTTEILEGFDVQRTSGLADTLKKYGYLTHAIHQYYKSLDSDDIGPKVCPPYEEFIRKCDDLEKVTVSDVFAIQLMQVPQVTEQIAIAVLDMYPTLASLARAYSELEGNVCEQEEMLRKQSNNIINGAASRNIFQLIWGG